MVVQPVIAAHSTATVPSSASARRERVLMMMRLLRIGGF
jgi:hypothetical protein